VHADDTCIRIQLADWLESYAHALELDVWTSSTVTRASQDPESKKWTVEIERSNAERRSFVVNHLVFAVGLGGGTHYVPQIPGAVGARGYVFMFVSSNVWCLLLLGRIQRHGRARWRLHEGQGLRREKGGRGRRLHFWRVVVLSNLPWIRFHL
jgi:hypothetical protein